jgi:hypothetical protein
MGQWKIGCFLSLINCTADIFSSEGEEEIDLWQMVCTCFSQLGVTECKQDTGSVPGQVLSSVKRIFLSLMVHTISLCIQLQRLGRTRLVVDGPHFLWLGVTVQVECRFDSGSSYGAASRAYNFMLPPMNWIANLIYFQLIRIDLWRMVCTCPQWYSSHWNASRTSGRFRLESWAFLLNLFFCLHILLADIFSYEG